MNAHWAQPPLPFAPVRRPPPTPVIPAAANEQARAWLARVPAWPQGRLALWGPPGCGKSRLLAQWAARHGATLVAGPALRFVPPTTPLAIDDADSAAPDILLHMLNAASEAGQPVLLAARTPPARWPATLPDLTSRLRAITATAIDAPDDTLLRALLGRLLAERQLRPTAPTLDWLLARLPRTHAAIIDAVARLDTAAQALATAITPALARHVLPDLLADPPDLPDLPDQRGADDDFASTAPAVSPAPAGLL